MEGGDQRRGLRGREGDDGIKVSEVPDTHSWKCRSELHYFVC